MPKIDLNPQDWNEVCRILQIHAPNYPVWAFGSRVKRKAKAYSDLDLAIITQQPLSLSEMAILKEAFDDSNLPIRVDIVDWAATSPAFQKIIKQDKVLIQEGIRVMHTSHNLKSQRGAVLAFCLLMLLLLTLAGTRMIQQNKQQLEMSGNTRILTQEFANAEGLLANAKSTINTWEQHIDPVFAINHSSHQCVTMPGTFTQQIGSAGSITGSGLPASNDKVMILAASCKQTKYSTPTKCTSYNAGVITCHPKSGDVICTTKTIAQIAALFNDPTDLCYQPYDPNCDNPKDSSNPLDENYNPNPRCSDEPPPPDKTTDPPTCRGNYIYQAAKSSEPEKCVFPIASCPYEVYTIKATSTNANGTTREIISDHAVLCASN
ncbi:MAG: nucleotidyltransferase domain-containing protein [Methylococcaceae bacterium]